MTYFADVADRAEIPFYLNQIGVKPTQRQLERQAHFDAARHTYCPDGYFEPDQMLNTVASMYHGSVKRGFAGARVSGEMSWALRGIPGSERLIEYEARLNLILPQAPTTAMCQYDARRFDGAVLFDVLSVHPMMVVHGQIVRNPAYRPPEEFLNQNRG